MRAFDNDTAAGVITMPRGALGILPSSLVVDDRRVCPPMPKLGYAKELDGGDFAGQVDAVKAMFQHEQGQVRMPTGSGKTDVVLAFVAACKTRTLVVVHTQDLVNQWVERAEAAIPGIEIGLIGAGSRSIGHLTIATIQTLRKKYLGDKKLASKFGCVVRDEGHHLGAAGDEQVFNTMPARYRFAVSASSKRSDGRERLVDFSVGPVIYELAFRSQVPVVVKPIFSDFTSKYNVSRWTHLVRAVVSDETRNQLIADQIEREAEHGTVLVLSRQIVHLENIAEKLALSNFAIVTGQSRLRREHIQAMRDGELQVILGTQLFEEGVDIPNLRCVVLAFPGTDVTTLQKVGRVTRKHVVKDEAVVLDIVDPDVIGLARQYAKRRAWYLENPDFVTVAKPTKGGTDGTQEDEGRKLRPSEFRPRLGRSSG